MKKLFLTLLLLLIPLILLPKTAQAKVLPQAAKAGKATSAAKTTGIGVSAKLRADRRAVIVYFSNLQNAKSVSYALTYRTSEQEEGAMGGINITGKSSTSQEILFGTCSKGVCRYHTGVNNVKLEVSYTTTSGKKYLKKFKIRV